MLFYPRVMALIALTGLVTGLLLAADEAELRTWTSADGRFTTQAVMIGYQDRQVLLRREDGREISVPLSVFGAADRRYITNWIRDRKEAAEAAAPQAPAAGTAAATDWPRWRGPNLDGRSAETGLLRSWPEGGPPLVWQVEGLGTGFASVSVVGGKIYTMGRQRGLEHVMALNAADGSTLWATPLGPGKNQRGSNGTPAVDGELVYAISIEGDLICVRADTGQSVWSKNFARDFGGRMMSGWGYSESPLIDGNLLLCTPGGPDAAMAALDKRTGKVVWTTAMPYGGSHGQDGAGYSSIVISHGAGVKQYVQLVGRGVIGVDAASGRLLWRYDRIANGTANIPTPIAFDDYVFCSSGYGTGAALLKIAGGSGRVEAREQYFLNSDTLQNHHGGMVLIDGYVYCGHGHNNGFPICVDIRSGRVVWGGDERGPGTGSAAVTCADGHLYFRYQNGVMALIEATPERYNLKSSFKLASVRAESWPHPVISAGRLYARDQEVLMCYDVKAR